MHENDIPPVRQIELSDIESARERIRGTAIRTPLIQLRHHLDAPEIWLKLENLQPINAYKLRGAANAVAMLDDDRRRRGVWTVSAGNAGQGVAFAARAIGVPCTILVIETAPQTKIERMQRLGAKLIMAPYEVCWEAVRTHHFDGMEGTLVHPFDDHNFIAGNATLALEILEDLPGVRTILAGIGGGGLVTAIGSAVSATQSDIQVLGVEPETAAPASLSFAAGQPMEFPDWTASFVDGAGGHSIFPRMWERMREVVDGSIVVTLDETRAAMKVIAEKARVIAEGAGALGVAAALSGRAGDGPIVAVISGGNIDLRKFAEIVS